MSSQQPPRQMPPGWYPLENGGGMRQYWDGHQWVGQPTPPPEKGGLTQGKLVLGVAGGIILALIVVGLIYQANQPSVADQINKQTDCIREGQSASYCESLYPTE